MHNNKVVFVRKHCPNLDQENIVRKPATCQVKDPKANEMWLQLGMKYPSADHFGDDA